MKKIKYIISLIVLGVLLSGCGSPFRYIEQDEVINNKYISFKAPSKNWEISKKYKTRNYHSTIRIGNDTPKGAQYDITVHTDPSNFKEFIVFKKDTEYVNKNQSFYDRNIESFKERGITYAKEDEQYIQGMKCYAQVRGEGNVAYIGSSVRKVYDIWCGYYDSTETKNDGRRELRVSYVFAYYPDNTHLQKDKNTPKEQIKSREELEMDLKIQVKKLIDSMVIKNFDFDRMIKEGLYHPNKKYEHMKW
jgi:uncharacterized protein YceK